MPNYVPTDWADGVTPVDEAHMDKMEAGIVGAVPRDGSVAAAGEIYRSKLIAADAQPAFRQLGDGRMEWGAGGAAASDTNLYRASAGVLKTDWGLELGVLAGGEGLRIGPLAAPAIRTFADGTKTVWGNKILTTDANVSFRVWGDGKHEWGVGGATVPDTNLYRYAAGILATDGQIYLRGGANSYLAFQFPGEQARFFIGPSGEHNWGPGSAAQDTNLYRSSSGHLTTDGTLEVGQNLIVDKSALGAALYFGSGTDTRLYRASAGNLQTDGGLLVGGAVGVDHSGVGAGLYFGAGMDVLLSRAGAGQLALQGGLLWVANRPNATDVAFQTGPPTGLGFFFTAEGRMNWAAPGSGADTTLYRVAPGTLATDGVLNTAGIQLYPTGNQVGIHFNPVSGANYMVYARVQANANPHFQIDGGGGIYWGDGAAAVDTHLFRWGAGMLKTDGWMVANLFAVEPMTAGDTWAYTAKMQGDSQPRYIVARSGQISFGPGGAVATDTALSRLSPGVLGINGVAIATGSGTLPDRLAPINPTGITDWDSISASGWYNATPGRPNGPPPPGRNWAAMAIFDYPGYGVVIAFNEAHVSGTFGYLRLCDGGSWSGWQALNNAVASTNLPTNPVDGQEATLVDVLAGGTAAYAWKFRYNATSTSAYKWEFAGGAEQMGVIDPQESRAGNVYGDMATVGPTVKIPRAGIYNVSLGCQAYSGYGGENANMSYQVGAAAATDADAIVGLNYNVVTYHVRRMQRTFAAGINLVAKYRCNGAGSSNSYAQRHLSVIPVRVA